jgi:fructose-1,6-bisphosphatase I
MPQPNFLTLDEFTIQQYRNIPNATGELSKLLRDISLAAKRINVEVSKAGLADILGELAHTNVQGESVKKLDVFANDQMIGILRHGVSCAGVCSEELDDIVRFDDVHSNKSKYVVMLDPLDGSSNIDTNVSIGTIFGIYRRISEPGTPCTIEDFLQPGLAQVAAGYIIYGSSTMFVYGTRRGINGFTLDPGIGEFCLSHPDITCPAQGNTFSMNAGYYLQFDRGIQQYLNYLQTRDKTNGGPFTQRFTGSMVADLHRTLLKGGIFIYPLTTEHPKGKLRLMYECNPFAFMMEIAGGKASTGKRRILDIQPASIHERTPIIIGSEKMVDECLHQINAEA